MGIAINYSKLHLGQKSPLTNVSFKKKSILDKCSFDKGLLGQLPLGKAS